jgi:hypothetical protein
VCLGLMLSDVRVWELKCVRGGTVGRIKNLKMQADSQKCLKLSALVVCTCVFATNLNENIKP